MLEKVFKLRENGTDVKTEVIAGITTFMTMAYILAVNPSILSAAGMDSGAVFTATALAALHWHSSDGSICKLSVCTCTRYGTECIFCIYSCTVDCGIQLESCTDSSICRRYYLYYSVLHTNVREAIFNAIPKNLKRLQSA